MEPDNVDIVISCTSTNIRKLYGPFLGIPMLEISVKNKDMKKAQI